jgi:hypothetical protein
MRVAAIVVQLLFGVALVLFGRWAARHAGAFVPAGLPAEDRVRRTRVTTRGAIACQIAGAAFAAMNLVLFF